MFYNASILYPDCSIKSSTDTTCKIKIPKPSKEMCFLAHVQGHSATSNPNPDELIYVHYEATDPEVSTVGIVLIVFGCLFATITIILCLFCIYCLWF